MVISVTDEKLVDRILKLNEDILTTQNRLKDVKNHKKPIPFKMGAIGADVDEETMR